MINKIPTPKPKINNAILRLVLFLLFLFTPFILYLALTKELLWLTIICEAILASVILTLLLRK